jgi:pimeloyl-ACP methyl ester carboxylesterase
MLYDGRSEHPMVMPDFTRGRPVLNAIAVACLLILANCSPGRSGETDLQGRWVGRLTGQRGPQLVFDLRQEGGKLYGTVSVPAERLLGKPVEALEYDGGSLSFEVPAETGDLRFTARRVEDTFEGVVRKGGVELPVRLVHAGPIPPTPYREDAVGFSNQGLRLEGSVLVPPGPGPHPGVVFIHGSSTPSRDDLRFFADAFARNGVASLIYDKRPAEPDDSGDHRVDLRDLAADAAAAVRALREHPGVDASRVGLWGFSQGGWVAPIAATQAQEVAFLIVVSGPGVTYAEQVKHANAERLRRKGFSEDAVRSALQHLEALDDYARGRVVAAAAQAGLDAAWRQAWAKHANLPRRLPDDEELRSSVRWRNLDLDPRQYWRAIKAPVLLLYGGQDAAVPATASAERITAALNEDGEADVTVHHFPQADHNLQPAPNLVPLMLAWVDRKLQTKAAPRR